MIFNSRVLGRNALGACVLVVWWATAPAAGQQVQWRGVWADCFHSGFKTTAQIDSLVQRAAQGRYNAIVAEVMGFQDGSGDGHGAYWNSGILPKAPDASGFDPLAYLCHKAGEKNIQVHAWLVTYRASSTWPITGNTFLAGHPEYFMVPRAGIDSDPVWPVGDHYVLDPGSPDVQEYLVSIVRELVTNYPIHGINWDYIRYTQYDAGYPARSNYQNSGLKRFQRIYNRSDTPAYNDSQWNDFRRRTLDELIRRCRAEIASIRTNPNQPVMQTADLFSTGWAPSSFTNSQAYKYFQNWKLWAESGWLDAVMPMNYKRDHCSDQYGMYRSWIDKTVIWKGPRHAYCGQGNYLNSFANSVAQMQYVFSKGAEGACNYSYVGTRADETICDDDEDPWSSDWTWYTHVASTVYTAPATPPPLPWRDPATATEGTLWGRVLSFATGLPLDDATVTVYGRPAVKTDGNGYYTVTLIPAAAGGSQYSITVSKSGHTALSYPGATVFRGDVNRYDFSLGAPTPQIVVDPSSITRTVLFGKEPPTDQFQVKAAPGRGILNYTIGNRNSWLTVSPASGMSYGEDDPITITYQAGLQPGVYTGTIVVSDLGAVNNPQNVGVTLRLTKPCDFDMDDDVDQQDFGFLQSCLTGVGVPVTDPDCGPANLDGDSDVDEADVQKFIGCMSGPDVHSNPLCLN